MKTLRLERFDANSDNTEAIGCFEINDIEVDALRLEAFLMKGVDADAEMSVLDIDKVSDWLDKSDASLLIIASSTMATFLLRKEKTRI